MKGLQQRAQEADFFEQGGAKLDVDINAERFRLREKNPAELS